MTSDVVMSNVASLDDHRPHMEGEAVCLACKYDWVQVAPAGTVWFECPACGLERGRFRYRAKREGVRWECACGNDLFQMTPEGAYCPNCGAWQKGFWK